MRTRQTNNRSRRGTSAVEFAVVLPFLAFMVAISVDFARVYRHAQVVMSAARNGALYASDSPERAADTAGITAAALRESVDLAPPEVTTATGTDEAGNPYIRVTVACPFQTITRFPGVPSSFTVTRTTQMRVAPTKPAGTP